MPGGIGFRGFGSRDDQNDPMDVPRPSSATPVLGSKGYQCVLSFITIITVIAPIISNIIMVVAQEKCKP